jgi:antitoxin (DNA-binding transcriptional repressor) of toxin-antitoxin stability system
MRYVPVRELRTAPGRVWECLNDQEHVVLTNNGQPQALMIGVDAASLDETIAAVEQARVARLVAQQQTAAVAAGLDSLSIEEIDAEIAASRKARRAH